MRNTIIAIALFVASVTAQGCAAGELGALVTDAHDKMNLVGEKLQATSAGVDKLAQATVLLCDIPAVVEAAPAECTDVQAARVEVRSLFVDAIKVYDGAQGVIDDADKVLR